MSNIFDETRRAVSQARETLRAADSVADDMAFLLRGRLRKVSRYNLQQLKRELNSFNSKTGQWKD